MVSQLQPLDKQSTLAAMKNMQTPITCNNLDSPDVQSTRIIGTGLNTVPNNSGTDRFVSREEELAKLTSAIENGERKHLIDIAITGMPGVGKTLLVQKFIKDNISKFHHVIWIPNNLCNNDFVSLAKKLNILRNSYHPAPYFNVSSSLYIRSEVYSELSKSKTLIVFDNVLDDVLQYLPSFPKKGDNIMVVVTSLFNEWKCGLHLPLECFSEEVAKQYLVQNLGDIADDNVLRNITCEFSNLPLALNNLAAYYKQKQQINELNNVEYTINDLMQETVVGVNRKKYNPQHLYYFKPFSFLNDKVDLQSMCSTVMETLSYRFKLASKILKFLSYLECVDVSVFKNFENYDLDNINEAIIILYKFSLIEIKLMRVTMVPVIKHSIQYTCHNDKETDVLKQLLTHFQKQITQDHDKLPQLDTQIKIQIHFHIFDKHYINDSLLLQFDMLFVLAAVECIAKHNRVHGMTTVYKAIIKRLGNKNNIKFHCFYIQKLCENKAYKQALETSDLVISQECIDTLKQTFYGLKLLYYKCMAHYKLNEKLQEAWYLCQDVHTLCNRPFMSDNKSVMYSLVLLCKIACVFKGEDIKNIELIYKNVVQRVCCTIFDWKDPETFVQEMKAIGIITDHYLKLQQANTALEYIRDLKSKLDIRHGIRAKEDNDYDINQTIAINKYLDLKICECLLELNETKEAWNKLHDLIQIPNFYPQFTCDILLTLCKIAAKLNEEHKNEEVMLCYDDVKQLMSKPCKFIKFNTTVEALQLLSDVLINNDMKTQALDVYDIFEPSLQMKYSHEDEDFMNYILARAQLLKYIFMYEHNFEVAGIWEKSLELLDIIEFDVASCFKDKIIPDLNSFTKSMILKVLIKAKKYTHNHRCKNLKLNL